MKKRPTAPPDSADPAATAAQAGIEKTLYDELNKGLHYAGKALAALDDQERQNLLAEAELAYQNAIYLAEQSSTPPESPITKQLHTLGGFLVKNSDNQKEGN
ncbi:MAG TPA: hypothetical protein VHP35_15345 [Terriglobia bacterium]|nr:hypothetical protein [Terriglobia bacterium]